MLSGEQCHSQSICRLKHNLVMKWGCSITLPDGDQVNIMQNIFCKTKLGLGAVAAKTVAITLTVSKESPPLSFTRPILTLYNILCVYMNNK